MVVVIHDRGQFEADLYKGTSLEKLKGLLVEDAPILIESSHHNTALRNLYPTVDRELFFMGQGMTRDLSIKPRFIGGIAIVAKASHAYEKTDWGMEGYFLNVLNRGHDSPAIVRPYHSSQEQFNEGTFSPAGGTSWSTYSRGRTERILIGKPVTEQFAAELRAVTFAERGICFDLPSFYGRPGYLVRQAKRSDEEKDTLERRASHLTCITAVRNLIEQASIRMYSPESDNSSLPGRDLTVTQVGYWHAGYKMFAEKGHPVNDEDYAINELSHPGRLVGFVKPGRGGPCGRTFVYPTEWAKKTFALAFSEDFISEYFPAERRDRK